LRSVACPARHTLSRAPGRPMMDAQLRDLAILATLALLFVLTLNILAITRRRH
jgi:hypothetical protein